MTPKYTFSEGVGASLAVSTQAFKEVRAQANEIRELTRQVRELALQPGGWDDFHEEKSEDGRTIIRRYTRGDQVKEFHHTFDFMIYRDIFTEGKVYAKSDVVTWGGSAWIAKTETSAKPGDGPDWKLFVKRGRDGKEVVSVPRETSKPVKI